MGADGGGAAHTPAAHDKRLNRQAWPAMLGRMPALPSTACRVACHLLLLSCAAALPVAPATAGPPLITDDAQVLGGAGRAELIVAATGLRQASVRQIDGPVADLTVGLSPRLDATLVASVSRLRGTGAGRNAALLCPGIKWQAARTGRFNLSLSPALMLDLNDGDATAALLPVQAELVAGDWTLGVDAGHIATRHGDDQWQAGSYAVWAPTAAVAVLGEL